MSHDAPKTPAQRIGADVLWHDFKVETDVEQWDLIDEIRDAVVAALSQPTPVPPRALDGHTAICESSPCTCGAFEALYISRSEAARLAAEAVAAVERQPTPEPPLNVDRLGRAMLATGIWPRGYRTLKEKWPALVAAEYARLTPGDEPPLSTGVVEVATGWRHLDFCSGGEFCTLDDCLCECHRSPEPPLDVMDAIREVVRFYGTDRTWSLAYRTLLGSRIDDLARAAGLAPGDER